MSFLYWIHFYLIEVLLQKELTIIISNFLKNLKLVSLDMKAVFLAVKETSLWITWRTVLCSTVVSTVAASFLAFQMWLARTEMCSKGKIKYILDFEGLEPKNSKIS